MPGIVIAFLIILFKVVLFLVSLGVLFNSARVLHSPEGNYDAEAKLSARIVFIIALVATLYFGASLFWRAISIG
jgi:hypothetical protein